jgi:methylphosphotriester-DNA--protein-cysteine methyltransferase
MPANRKLWRTKKGQRAGRYLFSHKALATVFRAKLLEALSREGSESEAAFNRAFKRRFDSPPARYRRDRRAQRAARTLRPDA